LELLELAEKYSFTQLMTECAEYLKYRVRSENVLKIAQLAERSEMEDLKKYVIKFIQNNPDQLYNEIAK